MNLETITKNQEEYKKEDLKSLAYKFLNYNIEAYSLSLYERFPNNISKKREEVQEKIRELFFLILERKKEDILSHLKTKKKSHFLSLLTNERSIYSGLSESEEKAIILTLDKEIVYSFFLGYGMLLSSNKNTCMAREIGEKTLNLAQKNGDLVYLGRSKKVLKIKTHFNKKTIVFKKVNQQNMEELSLENHIWIYYDYYNRKLLGIKGKDRPNFDFNLPEKISYFPGTLEDDTAYLAWRADSEELLNRILKSDDKTKKELTKAYLKEVAKLDAFGPASLVPKQMYLTTKKAFLKRMRQVINKKAPYKLTEKILKKYGVIAKCLNGSKVKGVVKDAILKNATCAIKKVVPIDFDRLRIAPLQMDLSKALILSYNDRYDLLKEFIQEYNSAAEFFNKNFTSKPIFIPCHGKNKEPKKQKIEEWDEFYFVYLNSVVDYSLHFLLEDEYQRQFGKLDIKNIQKQNALHAIEELKTKYKKKYGGIELEKLESLSEMFKSDFYGLI